MNQKIESQNGVLEDITACTTGRFCLSDDPKMMELKSHTPARIGIGRTGSRYLTKAYLRFRADHAAANDAVMTEVSQETLERLHLPQVQTRCKDKYEMLTRPDLGRLFDDENKPKSRPFVPQIRMCRSTAATACPPPVSAPMCRTCCLCSP